MVTYYTVLCQNWNAARTTHFHRTRSLLSYCYTRLRYCIRNTEGIIQTGLCADVKISSVSCASQLICTHPLHSASKLIFSGCHSCPWWLLHDGALNCVVLNRTAEREKIPKRLAGPATAFHGPEISNSLRPPKRNKETNEKWLVPFAPFRIYPGNFLYPFMPAHGCVAVWSPTKRRSDARRKLLRKICMQSGRLPTNTERTCYVCCKTK